MISCVLWDFGDTLVDETWMLPAPEGYPEWTEAYRFLMWEGKMGEQWNTGEVTTLQVASHLAGQIGAPVELVTAHMKERCRDVSFFPHVMAAVRDCEVPQAIVTINTDIFSTDVMKNYGLADLFEPIVTSWETGTLDKAEICDVALAQFPTRYERSDALLIDNKLENVEGWRARGGVGYHFTTEDAFAADPPEPFVTGRRRTT